MSKLTHISFLLWSVLVWSVLMWSVLVQSVLVWSVLVLIQALVTVVIGRCGHVLWCVTNTQEMRKRKREGKRDRGEREGFAASPTDEGFEEGHVVMSDGRRS